MAGLLEHDKTEAPEAPEAAAPAPPAEAPPVEAPPARACATCGAALADGQDWCLECGSAQPGRLGGRPGWRAALTVAALTTVLVGGASAAGYAALNTDARTTAQAPAPPAATPTVTPPPVQTAPPAATTPTTATPTVKAPSSAPADVPPVKAPKSTPAPVVSSPTTSGGSTASSGATSGTTSGTTTTDTGSGTSTTSTTADTPAPLELSGDLAKTFDPYGRGGTQVGDPADAVDGKDDTAWTAPVDADGNVRIGLVVGLDKARKLSKVTWQADTPGFTVEVYATKSAELPPDVLDARWEHVGTRRDSDIEESVPLDGTYRHVLLWVTQQPADDTVAIPEVQLFG